MDEMQCLRYHCLTARMQKRRRSAVEGWRGTWGSLRCEGTPSPSAAGPPHLHPAVCLSPPAPRSLYEMTLHAKDTKNISHTRLQITPIQSRLHLKHSWNWLICYRAGNGPSKQTEVFHSHFSKGHIFHFQTNLPSVSFIKHINHSQSQE